MKNILPALLTSVLWNLVVLTPTAHSQGTALTYQGLLNDAAGPANGTYDFQFTVRDAFMYVEPQSISLRLSTCPKPLSKW